MLEKYYMFILVETDFVKRMLHDYSRKQILLILFLFGGDKIYMNRYLYFARTTLFLLYKPICILFDIKLLFHVYR